jgi:hypothetical protein
MISASSSGDDAFLEIDIGYVDAVPPVLDDHLLGQHGRGEGFVSHVDGELDDGLAALELREVLWSSSERCIG